jgi:hypothetical protein
VTARWIPLTVAVVVLLAVGWCARDWTAPSYDELEARTDSLDRALALRDSVERIRAAEDSARADSTARALEAAAAAERARREADRRAAAARTELAAHLADDTAGTRQLDELVAAHASALRADSATMAELRRVIDITDRRFLVLRDSTVPELRRDLAETVRQRDDWRKAAKRRSWVWGYVEKAATAGLMVALCQLVPGERSPC